MMPNDEVDEEIEGFDLGIRRKSIDKLTYKNIIADAINWCRKSSGTRRYKYNVQGLESIIMFDVTGYKLRTQIEEIQKNLEIQKRLRKNRIKNSYDGRDFYRTSIQAKFKIYEEIWYWELRFEMIIQLLASENLLLETEKIIPISAVKEIEG